MGQASPLVGQVGTRGFAYGPLPGLYFAIAYGLSNFNFGLVAFISSALALVAAFFTAASTASRQHAVWILLLSITSPLAIHFSTAPFWDTPILIPLAAATLWLARVAPPGWRREFVIGILLGLSLDVHPLAIPFAIGALVWRMFAVRHVRTFAWACIGAGLSVAPYLVGLALLRDSAAPTLTLGGRDFVAPSPITLITSLLRFWGQHPTFRLATSEPFRAVENWLATLSTAIIIAAVIAWVVFAWRERKTLRADSLMTLAGICVVVYLPFAYATGADRADLGQSLWWVAPVVLASCVLGWLGPRKGAWVLAVLVAFNIVTTGVEYWTRARSGTTAEPTAAPGQGPAWWMQLNTVFALCREVDQQIATGTRPPVVVETTCKFCDSGLPALTMLKAPQCARDTRFVSSSESPLRLRVDADQTQTYLTLAWQKSGDMRASGAEPPAGLVLRLASESLRGLATGAPVADWPDSSGLGNDAMQADPARQPVYQPAAVNQLPAVLFNGTSDVLLTRPVELSQDHTIVVVAQAQRTQDGTTDTLWSYAADETAATLVELGVYHSHGTARSVRTRYEGVDSYNSRPSPLLQKAFVIVQRREAGAVQTSIDGLEDVTASETTIDFDESRRFRFGVHSDAGQYLDGSIAEIRIYNGALPRSEIAALVSELMQTYRLVATN